MSTLRSSHGGHQSPVPYLLFCTGNLVQRPERDGVAGTSAWGYRHLSGPMVTEGKQESGEGEAQRPKLLNPPSHVGDLKTSQPVRLRRRQPKHGSTTGDHSAGGRTLGHGRRERFAAAPDGVRVERFVILRLFGSIMGTNIM